MIGMTSSWGSYYVVFLSALLSLGIPLVLGLLSLLFIPRKKKQPEPSSDRPQGAVNQTVLGQRMNVRFFLAANAALVLITLALELVPCVMTLQTNHPEGQLHGLIAIVTLAGFTVLGLLYSVRKGDMAWLKTYHSDAWADPLSDPPLDSPERKAQ
jgi:NADH:ubiquinone oxidoreductase subunit 3 (subunit A)